MTWDFNVASLFYSKKCAEALSLMSKNVSNGLDSINDIKYIINSITTIITTNFPVYTISNTIVYLCYTNDSAAVCLIFLSVTHCNRNNRKYCCCKITGWSVIPTMILLAAANYIQWTWVFRQKWSRFTKYCSHYIWSNKIKHKKFFLTSWYLTPRQRFNQGTNPSIS